MDDERYIGMTVGQFNNLKLATIVCSSISLAFSFVVVCVYSSLRIFYRGNADRVSLRCVFISSLNNCIASIMDIYIVAQPGNSWACLASVTVMMLFSVLSATALTLVGINLLLLFVFGVKNKKRLQYIYYPALVIYGLLSIIIPIYFSANSCGNPAGKYACWFEAYYGYSKCREYTWIWHYAFLMFSVLVALACSIVALQKLVREYQIINGGILSINRVDTGQEFRQKRSTIVTKVLLRCIMYTMVPFISNVWNFIAQVVIFVEGVNPPYQLVMFSVVFRSLEGVFVTCIFFSDPTVTSIINEVYESLWRTYVEEYRCIKVQFGGDDDEMNTQKRSGSSFKTLDTCKIPVRRVSIPLLYRSRYTPDETASTIIHLPQPSPTQQQQQQPWNDDEEQCCANSVIYRVSSNYYCNNNTKGSSPNPRVLTFDPHDQSKAYIPYRFPRLAHCIHCIFSMFRRPKHHTQYHHRDLGVYEDHGDAGPGEHTREESQFVELVCSDEGFFATRGTTPSSEADPENDPTGSHASEQTLTGSHITSSSSTPDRQVENEQKLLNDPPDDNHNNSSIGTERL